MEPLMQILNSGSPTQRYICLHIDSCPVIPFNSYHLMKCSNVQKKPYLRRLLKGPPPNSDLLEHLFRGFTVDGSIAYAPRNDYGEQRGQDGGAKETDRRAKENLEATPRSTSSKCLGLAPQPQCLVQ